MQWCADGKFWGNFLRPVFHRAACSTHKKKHNNNYHLIVLCLGLPGWASTRKIKRIWILLKQETVAGSGTSWSICKSAPRPRQIPMPAPHQSIFYRPDAPPASQPTASTHSKFTLRPHHLWKYGRHQICNRWEQAMKKRKNYNVGLCPTWWPPSEYRRCPVSATLEAELQESVDRLNWVSHRYSLLIDIDKIKVMASDGIACRIIIHILGWRLSGNLRYRWQEISWISLHRVTICTKDNDYAGDEKFRGCGPSHLEQFYQPLCELQLSPSDVRSTSEGQPVWLIGSASEDYLWCALKIHSSSSFMVALCNRADHIYFHYVVCSSFFFSSPNLSGRSLDVCHTFTHGVALVRI